MENPCDKDDMKLFYALTRVNIGNGNEASFWDNSWVDGISPKVLAPSIYAISKQKKWCVWKPLQTMHRCFNLTFWKASLSNTFKNSPNFGALLLI
jgi:hypothetical protein